MKKHLLMLVSWTMLLFGAFSFTSCGDDDDDDASSVVDKYQGKSGAFIDGDDVVYVQGASIVIYHFDGDKVVSGKSYTTYATKEVAQTVYNEAKKEADGDVEVELDGKTVIAKAKVDKPLTSMSKQALCDLLNGNYGGLLDDEDWE